jgi:hypothetical protein
MLLQELPKPAHDLSTPSRQPATCAPPYERDKSAQPG